ncbi:MAG: hypothetical protein ACUVQM_04345 [Candidatus Hadarchaeaceae archaeon]
MKLGETLIKKLQYGLITKSSRAKGKIRYIRINDITDEGQLKYDDPRFLDLSENEFKKYGLEKNDILIARNVNV